MRLEDDWVPMDEQLGASELEEALRAKGAHSSAVVLESVSILYSISFSSPNLTFLLTSYVLCRSGTSQMLT